MERGCWHDPSLAVQSGRGIVGLHLEIGAVSALVAGFFGIPGVILLLLYQLMGH
ncbi:MAG: pro-sigmaK processing inhibitor BofA family protein [Acidaminococcus intestini]